MKFWIFYQHFAVAYGTFWLLLFMAAFVSQSHINAGEFGVFGFPIMALIYAFLKFNAENDAERRERKLMDDMEYRLRRMERESRK